MVKEFFVLQKSHFPEYLQQNLYMTDFIIVIIVKEVIHCLRIPGGLQLTFVHSVMDPRK